MIVTSCFLLLNSQPLVATVPAIAFAAVLMMSLLLWARRDRIYPFRAMMALLGLLAITFPIVWKVVQSYGSPQALAAMNWPVSRWPTILVFTVVPAVMIWFIFLERSRTIKDGTQRRDSNVVA
jgi:hypothetical protein